RSAVGCSSNCAAAARISSSLIGIGRGVSPRSAEPVVTSDPAPGNGVVGAAGVVSPGVRSRRRHRSTLTTDISSSVPTIRRVPVYTGAAGSSSCPSSRRGWSYESASKVRSGVMNMSPVGATSSSPATAGPSGDHRRVPRSPSTSPTTTSRIVGPIRSTVSNRFAAHQSWAVRCIAGCPIASSSHASGATRIPASRLHKCRMSAPYLYLPPISGSDALARYGKMSDMTPPVLWNPPPDILDRSRIGAYLRWLAAERGHHFRDYHELWRWSVTDLAGFWQSIWDYFDVQAHTPPEGALAEQRLPAARWFPGA